MAGHVLTNFKKQQPETGAESNARRIRNPMIIQTDNSAIVILDRIGLFC